MIANSGLLAALLQGSGDGFLQQLLTFTVAGLATASVYAIASSGLVVTYTTSGIFNFAHGAFGMFAAFLYWQFSAPSEKGGWGFGAIPSIVLVVFVIAPLFGAVIERVLMRGLRGTSEVVKIVVTIGLMLAMMTIAPVIWPEDQARSVPKFFGDKTVMIAGVGISYHRLTIMAVAIAVALALRLLLFSTRLGCTMRAVVDDPTLARLNGIRPESVSMASWALGSSLAALSGVLIASQLTLSAVTLTLLVVNAFAAAVFGRLTSLPRAFVGAIVLGLAESWTVGFFKAGTSNGLERWLRDLEMDGWSVANLQPAMPAIVLFIVMWFTKDTRVRSHAIASNRERFAVPTWRMTALGSAALVVGTAMLGSLMSDGDLLSVGNGLLLAIVVLSLVPLTGYSGQICLAQMTFFGIGAIAMGHYGTDNVVVGLLAAVGISAVVGALVALPALRLKGIFLALLTAAFAMFVANLVFKQNRLMPNGQVDVPSLFEAVATPYGRLMQMAVVFALVGALVVGVRRSSLGRRLMAMKDTPEACQTLGMNLVGSKLLVFALSAAIAGLAGAVSGTIYTGDQFALEASMAVTMLGVVGGIGSVAGAFFGGMMLGAFQSIFTTVFAVNRIGWFGVWSLAVTDLLKVGPGLMGMNLGKNPTGAAPQFAEGFAPLAARRSAAIAAVVGAVALWALAATGVISNWSFVAALIVGLLGVAPLLAFAVAPAQERPIRAPYALAVGVAALAAVALADWESLIGSNGWRVVAMVVLGVVLGRVLFAFAGIEDPRAVAEPDANELFLDSALSPSEVWEIERNLDIHEAVGSGGRESAPSVRTPVGVVS